MYTLMIKPFLIYFIYLKYIHVYIKLNKPGLLALELRRAIIKNTTIFLNKLYSFDFARVTI